MAQQYPKPPKCTSTHPTRPSARTPNPIQAPTRPSSSTPTQELTYLTSQTLLTPLNLLLLATFLTTLYLQIRRPPQLPSLPRPQPPTVYRTFTPPTLLPYNGTQGMPVYLAIRGKVFDVTPGRNFYGPGGPYENFAGRDATRGLACGSFDEEMLTKDLEGDLDDLGGLGGDEMEALEGWEETFNSVGFWWGWSFLWRKGRGGERRCFLVWC